MLVVVAVVDMLMEVDQAVLEVLVEAEVVGLLGQMALPILAVAAAVVKLMLLMVEVVVQVL